jgi:D-glycero-alpha-D-manno-heptose-7-phosphate kinase
MMKGMVDDAINLLNIDAGDMNDFGRLLHESWVLKRSLSSRISNSDIDLIYETTLKAGAIGGKLLGGGGGGFILFFAPPERHRDIKEKLSRLPHVPFGFETLGTQIVSYSTQDY